MPQKREKDGSIFANLEKHDEAKTDGAVAPTDGDVAPVDDTGSVGRERRDEEDDETQK